MPNDLYKVWCYLPYYVNDVGLWDTRSSDYNNSFQKIFSGHEWDITPENCSQPPFLYTTLSPEKCLQPASCTYQASFHLISSTFFIYHNIHSFLFKLCFTYMLYLLFSVYLCGKNINSNLHLIDIPRNKQCLAHKN